MKTPYSFKEVAIDGDYKYVQLHYGNDIVGEYLVEFEAGQNPIVRIGGVFMEPVEGGEPAARVILITDHLAKLEKQLQHAVRFITELKLKNLI